MDRQSIQNEMIGIEWMYQEGMLASGEYEARMNELVLLVSGMTDERVWERIRGKENGQTINVRLSKI